MVIDGVIKDDLAMNERLRTVVDASREAMLNAARHSRSETIDLFAENRDGRLVVIVRDRGIGFEPEKAVGGDGQGLARSLLRRVEDAGGKVEIVSSPERGTEITIRLAVNE